MDWEETPAISTYLLWAARKRGIPGAGLWLQIPFYLAESAANIADEQIEGAAYF
jgi:hypothetical protein